MKFASFRNKSLRRFVFEGVSSGIKPNLLSRLVTLLVVLRFTNHPTGFAPKYHCHYLLKSKRYSLWLTEQWRVTFRYEGGEAHDIDLEQYH